MQNEIPEAEKIVYLPLNLGPPFLFEFLSAPPF